MLASAANPLRLLTHEDRSGSSASDLTMSFWPSLSAVVVPPVVPSAVVPPATPVLPPVLVPAPPVVDVDSVGDSTLPVPAPVLIIRSAEPFKLPPIADAKAYLNLSSIIKYYFHCQSSQPNAQIMPVRQTREMPRRVHIGKARLGWLFKMAPCISFLKIRDQCMTERALKCLLRLISIVALTQLQMISLPSCRFSMTVWASRKKSWLSGQGSMEWLTICLVTT